MCVIQCLELSSQVTIGAGIPPIKAALLDIKSGEADSENITSNSGGIVLPRVKLININTLEPFIKTTDSEWAIGNRDETKKIHTGLMVYNLNITSGGFKEGVHVWDGTAWRIGAGSDAWELKGNNGTDPANNYIGTKDKQGLSIRTDNTERIRITDEGKIGIGTNNPLYDLDVRGDALVSGTTALVGDVAIGSSSSGTLTANKNVYLKTVATAPATNISQLAIDNTSGEIYAVRGVAEDSKAFSYINYRLTTGSKAGDWIKDFNTMIPANSYTVIVVGSAFNVGSQIGLRPSEDLVKQGVTYTGQSVYAFEAGGTWRLTADYVSGSTTDGSSGIWDIYCLIINKSIVNILSPQIKTLQSGNTGTGTKPNGL